MDEGASSALFDDADLGDSKAFFEGKGKALQLKNINSKGKQWIGVPIILASNDLHECIINESHLKLHYPSAKDRRDHMR